MDVIINTKHSRKVKLKNLMDRKRKIKQNIPLFIMFLPILVFYIVFEYGPMFGLVMAFQNFNLRDGFLGSPFVGLAHFKHIFSSVDTVDVIKNTVLLGFLQIIIGFPFPIIIALLLNEARKLWFKKTVQTLIYLPHFLSWVIVGGIVVTIFSQETGVVNAIVKNITGQPYAFLYNETSWRLIYLFSGVWKEAGFGAIIYLAALSTIDPTLYEAAIVDGATKLRQVWHITLPGIAPTIILMLILSIGSVCRVGFDKVYVLQNPAVNNVADVISTYVYRIGLQNGIFSLTAALGFFQSVLNLSLLLIANKIAGKFDKGLW